MAGQATSHERCMLLAFLPRKEFFMGCLRFSGSASALDLGTWTRGSIDSATALKVSLCCVGGVRLYADSEDFESMVPHELQLLTFKPNLQPALLF